MSGWGIGFFRDNQALVEKSAEQVYTQPHCMRLPETARVVDSRIMSRTSAAR